MSLALPRRVSRYAVCCYAVALLASFSPTRAARSDALVPPWIDGVPFPAWARSVEPPTGEDSVLGDLVVFAGPSRAAARRGVSAPGARLPFFGSKRGPGCAGGWWLVGPLAWVCSDGASLSPEDPTPAPTPAPKRWYFVGPHGAGAYASFPAAEEGDSDRELEGGWGIALSEERFTHDGSPFGRTTKGVWVAMRDLTPASPSSFEGRQVEGGYLDFGWVVADRATVWSDSGPKARRVGARERFDLVHALEEEAGRLRIDDAQWLDLSDVARPRQAPPPAELLLAGERWVDVDLTSQTLVAYAGPLPIYATLVSTGRAESATPPGVHRIWVKLRSSTMGNVERDDLDTHYSLEEVPSVQFFDHEVGLHGAYWHRDFGRVKSHGCVNLSPADARWLFDFTEPHVPEGWLAAYPSDFEPGTLVRVR